jgi:hypothetical protein
MHKKGMHTLRKSCETRNSYTHLHAMCKHVQVYGYGPWRYNHDSPFSLQPKHSSKRARMDGAHTHSDGLQPSFSATAAALSPDTSVDIPSEMVMDRSRLVATCYSSSGMMIEHTHSHTIHSGIKSLFNQGHTIISCPVSSVDSS